MSDSSEPDALRGALERCRTAHRELNHRVRNHLQTLISTASFKARSSQDPAVRDALHAFIPALKAIGLIHQKLEGEAGDGISARAYLEELGDAILAVHHYPSHVALKVHVADIPLDARRGATLGMIVNELVVNSLRHGLPAGTKGTIEVALRVVGEQCRLTVEDDGVGFPADFRVGARGTGLPLVESLAAQIGGTVSYGPGARVTLLFDKAPS